MKNRPLNKKTILLTRPNNEPLASQLKELGAKVLELPLIDVKFEADAEVADDVLKNLACYEWILFTSANGVKGFFKEFFKKFKDIRCIGPCRIACVGSATADTLKEFFIQTDVIPEKATGEAMAEAILNYETIENLNILYVTGNLNDSAVSKILEEKGRAIVDTFPVYKTSIIELDGNHEALKDFVENGADAIYFASGSAVEGFVKNAKKLALKKGAKSPKAYSIGEKCSEKMKNSGIPVAKEAKHPNLVLEMLSEELG